MQNSVETNLVNSHIIFPSVLWGILVYNVDESNVIIDSPLLLV